MEHRWNEDGFLAESAGAVADSIVGRNRPHFDRAADLNRDCHRLLFACTPSRDDGRQVLVAALFLRVLEHYQATILLLRRGLISPAVVMARACLEAVFATRAIALRPEGLRRFILDDQIQRRRAANKAEQYAYPNLEELREAVSKGLRSEIQAEIESDDAKPFPTEEMSRFAGMHDWYVTVYGVWSKTAHSQVRDLEQYMDLDDRGELKSLKYAPVKYSVSSVLLTTMHAALLGADGLGRLFECETPDSFAGYAKYIQDHLEMPSA